MRFPEVNSILSYYEPSTGRLNNEGLKLFHLLVTQLRSKVEANYGGISLNAPVALGSITAAWTVLPADAAMIGSPRGVTQETGSNALRLDVPGIWKMDISFSIEHNELNAGRTFQTRAFSPSSGVGSSAVVIGVGRNTGATSFAFSTLFEVTAAEAGNQVQIQVGQASVDLTAVTLNAFSFSASLVSEFRG